jgi:hypothetical protein
MQKVEDELLSFPRRLYNIMEGEGRGRWGGGKTVFNSKIMTAVLGFFLLSLLLPAAALANAMPVYLERDPCFSIAPREDVPIRVEREELTIEIEEDSSETAQVTARYILTNKVGESLTVPMVFPYMSNGYGGIEPVIELNGEKVGYKVFGAGAVTVDYWADPIEFLDSGRY